MQWAIRTVAAVIVVVAVCAHPVRAQLLDRAEELLQAGKCRQAEIILSNIVLQKPTSFRAHLLLGEARYRQGELDGAAEALTKANSLKPGDPSVAALLGYVHFSRENWHQAIQHLEKATAGGVSAAQAWYRLGKAYEQTDQTNKARDTYYTGAIRNMDYAPLLVALARSEKKLGNIPEAAYWYRRATAAKPDDRALFFEMVNALADAESYLQAESALTKYIDRHPEDPKALLLLAEIYGKLGLTLEQRETFRALEELGKLSTDQRVELLQAYMDYAAWEDALKLYKKLLEDGVDRADVHRAAGIAHAALGNMDSAIEALSAAVRLSPKPDTIELLAGAYFQAGKPTEAFEQYRRLVQMNPTPEILQAAADAALRANLPGRAVPLLMRLAATDPDDPHLRVRVAKAAEKSGDIREALLQWQMALRLADGDFPTARIAISRLALTCGYRPWALQEFRRLPWGEMGGRDLLEASELAAGMGDRETMLQALRSAWEDTEASPDLRLEAAGRLLDEKEPVKLSEVHEVWRISTHP
ncbi:MAG: tetratricopeptide repeat protein, partial [Armatimonadota bacterium]